MTATRVLVTEAKTDQQILDVTHRDVRYSSALDPLEQSMSIHSVFPTDSKQRSGSLAPARARRLTPRSQTSA